MEVFDAAWQALDRGYGAFMNLGVNMQVLRHRWRPEIEGGVSKGRLAAILNHLSFAMLEAHDGYRLLFNEPVRNFSFDVRGSPLDHLDMVPHPSFNSWLFTIPADPSTYYDKPIAVLIGPGAVSNGDWESLRLGYHPMAKTFGKATNAAFTSSDFPDLGGDWFFTRATGSGYLVDGHRYLAHKGVRPAVEVWLERDDVAQGRDTVVEAAIRWIGGWTPRHPGGRRAPAP